MSSRNARGALRDATNTAARETTNSKAKDNCEVGHLEVDFGATSLFISDWYFIVDVIRGKRRDVFGHPTESLELICIQLEILQ